MRIWKFEVKSLPSGEWILATMPGAPAVRGEEELCRGWRSEGERAVARIVTDRKVRRKGDSGRYILMLRFKPGRIKGLLTNI